MRLALDPDAACISFAHILTTLLDNRYMELDGIKVQVRCVPRPCALKRFRNWETSAATLAPRCGQHGEGGGKQRPVACDVPIHEFATPYCSSWPQRELVRYFGAGSVVLCLHYTHLPPFELWLPPLPLQWQIDCETTWLQGEIEQLTEVSSLSWCRWDVLRLPDRTFSEAPTLSLLSAESGTHRCTARGASPGRVCGFQIAWR